MTPSPFWKGSAGNSGNIVSRVITSVDDNGNAVTTVRNVKDIPAGARVSPSPFWKPKTVLTGK